jgi:hypothetical protein
MKTACYNDQESLKEKKPAVEKMKLLSIVSSELSRKNLHVQFLENNILDGIKLWYFIHIDFSLVGTFS